MKAAAIIEYDPHRVRSLPDGALFLHTGKWEEKEVPKDCIEVRITAQPGDRQVWHRGYALTRPLVVRLKQEGIVTTARLNFTLSSSRAALLAVADYQVFSRPLVYSYGFTPSKDMTFNRYIGTGPTEENCDLTLAVPQSLADALAQSPTSW